VNSLMFEIVQRHETTCPWMIVMGLIVSLQKNRDHPRLPIVQMKYVGMESHRLTHRFKDCALEEREALDIERIIDVQTVVTEIEIVIDQIDRYTVLLPS